MDEQSENKAEEVKTSEVDINEVSATKEQAAVGPTLTALVDMLHKAVEDARVIVADYQKKLNRLAEIEKSIVSRETSLKGREDIFTVREAACKKVEDAVSLHEEAKRILDSANLRLEAASEAERKLNAATSIATQEISDARALAQREANAVLEQRKAIEQEVNRRVTETLKGLGITTQAVEAVKE